VSKTTRFAIALAICALAAHGWAAETRSVRFEQISREEGLSQSFVYSIAQDDAGFMWFGTQEGLNRFDGYEFRVFTHDPNDPTSLADQAIRRVFVDSFGALWIGTDTGGLSRYDSATESFETYRHDPADPASLGDDRVRYIYEDSTGSIWVGTDGSGLDRFDRDTGTFEHFRHDASDSSSLSGENVWSIVEDGDAALWVATDAGLNRLDRRTGAFEHFIHDPDDPVSISDDQLRALFVDADGQLWVGTESGGLNRYDAATSAFERFLHSPDDPGTLSANRVNVIFQDDGGVLWTGTVNGLNAWNPVTRSFSRYRSNPDNRYSLSHDNVLSLFQDRSGVLWVGTYDGLSKWNHTSRSMLHYRKNGSDDGASLNENTITSFAEDRAGNIWVATFGGGLNVLDRDGNRFSHVRHDPGNESSLSSDHVMTVYVDSEGVLWAGTRASGLNRYDAATGAFERFRHDPDDASSISHDGVTYILEDSRGDMWVATFGGGLNRFDRRTRQFTRFQHDPDDPQSLSNDRVLVLFEDSSGILWVGTYGGGLNRLDPASGRFTAYTADERRSDGLSGGMIFMITEDAHGDLWIGAKSAGLNRWRRADRETGNASFQRFSELDGLPSNTIYSGIWDDDGLLWMSTSRGVSVLDTGTLEFRNYDTSHGLQGDEFNLAAGLRASDGRIFFGGLNGFNAFDPARLNGNRVPPKIAITQFLSLNTPVDLGAIRADGAGVELKHDQDVISFEFAALDFAAPRKNRYRYRLEGIEDDWIEAGTNRQVTYTNLPAGRYSFHVQARNNDGILSDMDATLSFRMKPAPWKTWWAYSIYAAALFALGFVVIHVNETRTTRAAQFKHASELQLIQERLNEAQRIAGIGNWDWDIADNELWWSDEIYRLFHLDGESFGATYEAFLEHVHPDDRETLNNAVQRALYNSEPYSIDHRIVLADGSERTVHERAEVFFDDDGKPVRMAGTIHDITDRKQAENLIRHRADFQALLAELSSAMVNALPENIEQQLQDALEIVGAHFDLDSISIQWIAEQREFMRSYHRWTRMDSKQRQPTVGPEDVPWIAENLARGNTIIVNDVEDMPPEASKDQITLRKRGTRSLLDIPLMVDDSLEGSCVFSMVREKREWTAETITELKLIAEKLSGAVARAQAFAEIENLSNQLKEENLYLREEVRLAHGFDEIVGEDASLRRCLQAVEKVAPTDVTVLLLGETGTGKELFARAIHKLSARRDGPMISVNCPTLPANLIESELFGHEKGAFTGAEKQRRGRFEVAEGGTLFLDEIGELPLELQAKLLRVLQTGEFERLGGTRTLRANVRLIAATNRNLPESIERGEFRSDLYYRISSFPVSLPALRERKADIPLLAEHFVHKHSVRLGRDVRAISSKMIKELTNYSWPGNVRELESIIERALISANGREVLDLPGPLSTIAAGPYYPPATPADDATDLHSVERSHIIAVLDQTKWKISGPDGAASVLGMPSSTLRSKMKKLGIRRKTR